MNPNGHPASLEPLRDGNTFALKSGVYSPRVLSQRAAEIADSLARAPHIVEHLDRVGLEEIAALLALAERIDLELEQHGITTGKRRDARSLLDVRLRLAGKLERLLDAYGLTPAARASWAKQLATGGLAEQIRRRIAEAEQT